MNLSKKNRTRSLASSRNRVLFFFFWGIYTFVPEKRLKAAKQIPGALFSALGWMIFSLGFSIYFNRIGGRGYSYMYGSLAAIVILLLWLYFCMCILFMGAELNWFFVRLCGGEWKKFNRNKEKRQ